MSMFEVKEYEPSQGFSLSGLPVILGLLAAAALALGWLASFISQWFYLIFLFPLAIGGALAVVGYYAVYVGKLRSIWLAMLLGLAAGCLAMITMHYFDGQRIKQGLSLWEYMDWAAQVGVTIGGRRGRGGFNLGYTGSWIYWTVEMLVVAVISLLGLVAGADEPFCKHCDRWKEERKSTLHSRGLNVGAFVKEGDVARLKKHKPNQPDPDLRLTVWHCSLCREHEPIAIKLERITKDEKGEQEFTELAHVTYPGEALPDFEELLNARGDEEEVPLAEQASGKKSPDEEVD